MNTGREEAMKMFDTTRPRKFPLSFLTCLVFLLPSLFLPSLRLFGESAAWNVDRSLDKRDTDPFCSSTIQSDGEDFYALVIDAGSSGSRMNVYTWSGSHMHAPIEEIKPPEDMKDQFKIEPGLSSYASQMGKGAGESLAPLINAAKSVLPDSIWNRVPLYVLSTAGMRSVHPRKNQLAIIDEVESYLLDPNNNPFLLEQVMIISGELEAVYGLISINIGILQPENWYAMLDLGGSSTQYAVYYEQVLANSQSFVFEEEETSIFAQSYPRYGQDDARDNHLKSLMIDTKPTAKEYGNTTVDTFDSPCYPKNYNEPYTISKTVNGTILTVIEGEGEILDKNDGSTAMVDVVRIRGVGDPDQCIQSIDEMLHLDYYCPFPPCGILGRSIPDLFIDKEYVAVSAFYYNVKNLGLVDGDSITLTNPQLLDVSAEFCEQPLPEDANKFIRRLCFSTLYMSRLLHSYGFIDDDQPIIFADVINNQTASWSYGAIIDRRRLGVLDCPENGYVENDKEISPSSSSSSIPSSLAITTFAVTGSAMLMLMMTI